MSGSFVGWDNTSLRAWRGRRNRKQNTQTPNFTWKIGPRVANLVLHPGRLAKNWSTGLFETAKGRIASTSFRLFDLGAKQWEPLQQHFVRGRRADNVNDIFKDAVFWCCPTQSRMKTTREQSAMTPRVIRFPPRALSTNGVGMPRQWHNRPL